MSKVCFTEAWLKERQEKTVKGSRTGRMKSGAAIQRSTVPTTVSRPSPYRSKLEANFASKCALDNRAGLIKAYAYEMHTFKLAHRQYHRSDFLIWHLDGSIEIAQVKGWHKNLRAGINGLKWAASLNPWFHWTLKTWNGTDWDSQNVEV